MANNDVMEIIIQVTDSASEVFNAIGQSSTAMGQSIGQAVAASGTEIGIVQERLVGLRDSTVSTFSEFSNEVSEAQNFLSTLAELMPWFASRLLSPWTLVTIEIGLAIKKYGEYMASIREWRGKEAAIDDPFTPADVKEKLQSYGKGMGDYRESERKNDSTPPPGLSQPSPLGLASGFHVDTRDKWAELEAKRLEEELRRMQDRLSQMINGMNEKIIGETGTTFQANSDRMTKEIDKMYDDLGQMADKGIDISGATAKIDEYRKVILEKFTHDQNIAKTETENQANQLVATITNNKGLLADLQRNAAYTAAGKESLNVYKKTGDKDLADKLKTERYAAADKINSDAHRDLNLEEINQQIKHNEMLIALENRTQAEIDKINKKALQDKIDLLDADIRLAGNDKAKVLKYEQEKVDATNKLHEMAGRSMSTASNESMRRIKAQTFDYAGLMVDTFNEINGSISNHLRKMLQGTESFSKGMKGIFSDMITNIGNMMLTMWMQKTIMGPLESLFGSVIGASTSDNSTSSGEIGGYSQKIISQLVGKKYFADGGYYPGGLALVGERGPELINFANPGQVYTSNDTENLLKNKSGSNGNNTIIFNISTPNTESFRQSQGQIYAEAHRAMNQGRRNL